MKTVFLYIAHPRLNLIDVTGCAFAVDYLKEGHLWSAAATFFASIIISAVAEVVARESKP